MKIIILIAYLIIGYLLIPLLFPYLGAIRKASTLSQEEINEDENDSEKLSESETAQMQKISVGIFVILVVYLCAFLGITFGLAANELFGGTAFKWVLYPLLYIFMISSLRVGRKMIEKGYEIKLSMMEQIIFFLTLLSSFLTAIWAKELIPFIWTWHWVY